METTKKVEKFPSRRRFFYNLSTAGYVLLDTLQASFLVYFFLPPEEAGLPELVSNESYLGVFTIFGMVYLFGRVVDSIADPLVAYWSDRSKSKLGRRRWFLVTGGLPLALFAGLAFFPPYQEVNRLNAVWLAIFLGGYYFFFTYYVGPYLSLIPELGHTAAERIKMTTWQALFALLGSGIVLIALPMVWKDIQAGGLPAVESFQAAVLLMMVPGLILAYMAPLVVNEKRYSKSKPAEIAFWESLKATVANRPFRMYLGANVLFWTAFHILRSAAMHYCRVIMNLPEDYYTNLMIMLGVGSIVSFPFIGRLSAKKGKAWTYRLGLYSFAAAGFIVPFMDMTPVNVKWVGLALFFIFGFPVAVLLVVPNAMLADITEYDAFITGHDREGMFFGAQGLFQKICMGLGTALIAALFAGFGKDVAQSLGVRLTAPAAGVMCIAALFFLARYPERSMEESIEEGRRKSSAREAEGET